MPEIQMDALRARKRVHQSRNPRIVRALVDLGFMRDQGEGIPRLFAEMEGQFLPEPELESSETSFRVTLRNSPTLTPADDAFISSLGSEELSDLEFRALLEASRHGHVDNARMRSIAGLDTLGASKLLGSLRDRNLLVLHAAGSGSYYELVNPQAVRADPRRRAIRTPVTSETNSRQLAQELQSVRGTAPVTLPPKLGRAEKIRQRIRAVCSDSWKTPSAIASALRMRSAETLTRRHLGPMVERNELIRRHEARNHPAQAYRAVEKTTALHEDRTEN